MSLKDILETSITPQSMGSHNVSKMKGPRLSKVDLKLGGEDEELVSVISKENGFFINN